MACSEPAAGLGSQGFQQSNGKPTRSQLQRFREQAGRYFFFGTTTNTIKRWRAKAPMPVSKNNTIGFIC